MFLCFEQLHWICVTSCESNRLSRPIPPSAGGVLNPRFPLLKLQDVFDEAVGELSYRGSL